MKSDDNECLQLFIEESREHLAGIEEDLLAIEQGGKNAPDQLIDKVFRAVHTIKGSASFFVLNNVKNLSHAMESVLEKIRTRQLSPTASITSVLLESADILRSMIYDLGNSEKTDISPFIQLLDSFLVLPQQTEIETVTSPSITGLTEIVSFVAPVTGIQIDITIATIAESQQATGGKFVLLLEIDTESELFTKNNSEVDLLDEIKQVVHIVDIKKVSSGEKESKTLVLSCVSSIDKDMLVHYLALPPERVSQLITGAIQKTPEGLYSLAKVLVRYQASQKVQTDITTSLSDFELSVQENPADKGYTPTNAQDAAVIQGSSLRVSLQTLDKLMTLAGEMVLTRNELLQNASAKNMQNIISASQRVDTITSELQEAIMSTRMQPIGAVLGKFRRTVRDLAKQLGKQIKLNIEGEEVELDKSIIEAIGDPLTHIIRNSVDHGIETPNARSNAGKNPEGTVTIRACHEAGHVVIEIIDDGGGIDPAVIRKKAKEVGLADDTTLASMSDREVIKFIFKPGFSTAEQVTDISGRGVGMDVVQSNLKKVGGAVDIETVLGKGTTLRIKLPLTLAIIASLLVIVQDERYAIPQANVVELVRIPASEVKRRIETIGGTVVIRLRGTLLPLIRVNDILGIQKTYCDTSTGEARPDRRINIADRRRAAIAPLSTGDMRAEPKDRRTSPASAVCIVIVAAGDFKYGLIVDSLIDTSEIVVKPLGYHLSECREYAGATILGDGQVALILDVLGIKRFLEIQGSADIPDRNQNALAASVLDESQTFLIVENAEQEFFAIPQGLIARIEKVNETMIKTTGGKQVLQYRGTTIRLFSIDEVIAVNPRKKSSESYVVIFHIGEREAGIITSEIHDMIELKAADIDDLTHVQTGVIGSAIIRDSITLLLDIFGLVKVSAPDLCTANNFGNSDHMGRILIVEDSAFFLQQIRSFIEDAGYETVCAEDGVKGLAILKNSSVPFDLVLTDIEMPNMNGLEMTRAIRKDPALQEIPVIAVTSVSGEKAEKTGHEAGINEYLIKLEREAVLAACKRYIKNLTIQSSVKEHI